MMPTRFRHYKGGIYELVCEATLESDLTPMIVYKSSNGSFWIRPKDVFFEEVDVDGVTTIHENRLTTSWLL